MGLGQLVTIEDEEENAFVQFMAHEIIRTTAGKDVFFFIGNKINS
jgi:hypothetical protein